MVAHARYRAHDGADKRDEKNRRHAAGRISKSRAFAILFPGIKSIALEFTNMIQPIEAVIDEHGNIQPIQDMRFPQGRRALVTILDEKPVTVISETALLSEDALAEDWNREEEDEAWSYLQPAQ